MGRLPLRIECDACLLLFDPHENVAWVRAVLERERGGWDHLLLGGDYFDAFGRPDRGGPAEMCVELQELRRTLGSRLTVLLGNHDISYLEARPFIVRGVPLGATAYTASGFSRPSAEIVLGLLGPDWWREARLFAEVNGHLVSHAGVAAEFWPERPSVAESLAALQEEADRAQEEIGIPHPLLGVGLPRGGMQARGGLTWLDFNEEFEDVLPLPQIFGHTPGFGGARRRGRSWCLDGRQSCYGILRRGGNLEVRTLRAPR